MSTLPRGLRQHVKTISALLPEALRSQLYRQYRRLRRSWQFYVSESALSLQMPRGHYYSPLPEPAIAARHAEAAFRRDPAAGLPGINTHITEQHELLLKMASLYHDFDWNEYPRPWRRFHLRQGWYEYADSICLYSMLRLFRPQRIIEVGSGFSSALMLDVNDHFLGHQTHFTFIEPHPDRLDQLLTPEDHASVRIIPKPVQTVPLEEFSSLRSGDFLFIDSSHISKTASDVNYLFFEVLPRLSVGVFVHVHDIFWPFEYPAQWMEMGCALNESYLLRAFLSFNESFDIVFWTPFVARLWPEIIQKCMPAYMVNTGAALWFRRVRT